MRNAGGNEREISNNILRRSYSPLPQQAIGWENDRLPKFPAKV